jgi:hypothetical protein
MLLFGDFIFARQLLNGVKRRAEGMGDYSRRTSIQR